MYIHSLASVQTRELARSCQRCDTQTLERLGEPSQCDGGIVVYCQHHVELKWILDVLAFEMVHNPMDVVGVENIVMNRLNVSTTGELCKGVMVQFHIAPMIGEDQAGFNKAKR